MNLHPVPKNIVVPIRDPHVESTLSRWDTLERQAEVAEDLMEIGALVGTIYSPMNSTLQISEELQRQQRRMLEESSRHQAAMRRNAEDSVEALERMEERLARTAIQTESALHELRAQTTNAVEALLKQLKQELQENSQDAHGVLERFEQSAQRTLDDLDTQLSRTEQAIAGAALLEKSAHVQGEDFEKRVYRDLKNFGRPRGDLVERVGTRSEAGTFSKKGDLLYHLKTPEGTVRVAIECKNRDLTLTGKDRFCLPELEEAMDERGADFGLVVAPLDKNSDENGCGDFPPLQQMGEKRFVVLLDENMTTPVALETALLWVERQLQSADANASVPGVDLESIQQSVERIVRVSSQCRSLKKTSTNLVKTAARLRQQLDEFDEELKKETRILNDLLAQH